MGFFNFFKRDISEEEFQEQQKVKRGLEKTRTGFFQRIVNTLTNAQIDDDLYDQLEEQLILADVGPACAVRLVDELRDEVQEKHLKTGQEALDALREEAQNLRVTLAACERDANALNQDGARMRREQSAVGVQIGEAHENREALTLRHQQSMQQLARDAAEQQTCAGRLEAAQQNLAARQNARNEEQETIRRLTQEIDSLRETLAIVRKLWHKTC